MWWESADEIDQRLNVIFNIDNFIFASTEQQRLKKFVWINYNYSNQFQIGGVKIPNVSTITAKATIEALKSSKYKAHYINPEYFAVLWSIVDECDYTL